MKRIILNLLAFFLIILFLINCQKEKGFTNYKIRVNIINDQAIRKDTIVFYDSILTYDGGYIRLIKNGKIYSYYTFSYEYIE